MKLFRPRLLLYLRFGLPSPFAVGFLYFVLSVFVARVASASEPPPLPLGLDAYRQWERWPYQRIGLRAYLRSTNDRRGGNEGADASHFLYQLGDDQNVALDLEGSGVLCFVRTNHWHGSPWHYVVDGTDQLVQESSTVDPTQPVPNSTCLPAARFPPPRRSPPRSAGRRTRQARRPRWCRRRPRR